MTTLDMIAAQPFLAGFPEPWLQQLLTYATPVVLSAGQRLFREDRRPDRFWLVCSGCLALDYRVPGGDDAVIETVGADSVVGWSWLSPPHEWHFGAVATQQASAVEFDASGVRRLMANDEALSRELSTRFMRVVTDRLRAARIRLLDLHRHEGCEPAPG